MKFKILELLNQEIDYISGEDMGKKLKISRAAVNKNIANLKKMGYNIDSVTNKGYVLKYSFDLLNEFEILKNSKTNIIGQNCIFCEEVDSTNSFGKEIAKDEQEGTVIAAKTQTGGRGRLGRQWHSPETGAWFSIVLKPEINPMQAPLITLIAGLAVQRSLKSFSALIKWPNDIVINGKKIAGILTEMSAEMERVKYVVLGIGINVNCDEFAEDLSEKATSLKIEEKKAFERAKIIKNVLFEFENIYNEFKEYLSFEPFLNEYKNNCVSIGKSVRFMYKHEEIVGECIDMDSQGRLLIKKEDEIIKIMAGEVSVRNENGNYI